MSMTTFVRQSMRTANIAPIMIGCLALVSLAAVPSVARAQVLQVTVENVNPSNGFYMAPLWFGLHDDGFDLFDVGSAASPGLELLAEDGPSSGLEAEFAGPGRIQGVVTGPLGFGSMVGQPPIIDGGETGTTLIGVSDPMTTRYFSFASMVVPSNDAFIGNGNPLAHQLFDAGGNFLGPLTIEVFGSGLWDAGTEVNDQMGAAFSTIGGTSSDEGGTVQLHLGLGDFEGTGTPVGTIGAGLAPGPNDLIARITISQVPEPASMTLVVMALAGMLCWRRSQLQSK